MRLHRRRLRAWVRPQLPGRTVRARLTWLYGALFLACGAMLLTVTGVLWAHGADADTVVRPSESIVLSGRRIIAFAGSATTVRLSAGQQSGPKVPTLTVAVGQLKDLTAVQRSSDLHQFLLYAGIALAVMALLSIVLGWLTAGRVLRPLRTITATTRDISSTNLHKRLGLAGPDDELRELGGTIDDLLGRLERAFDSQRRFVANAAHELRTPLATMRAAIDVSVAKPDPLPQTLLLAGRVREELDRVDGLLESFLTLARSEAGAVDSAEPVAIDHLAAVAVEEHAADIAAKGLDVRCGGARDAYVRGNEALLERMVGNMVDNAVRYNAAGGWIAVRTEVHHSTARLVVENGGAVLDADAVAELAKPFQRLGPERTSTSEGYGLGLSIVASIVESHGGNLTLLPLDAGGLRVAVELALADHTAAAVPA